MDEKERQAIYRCMRSSGHYYTIIEAYVRVKAANCMYELKKEPFSERPTYSERAVETEKERKHKREKQRKGLYRRADHR